jgi:hypothetical protein
VFGDGMHGRSRHVKQGDLSRARRAFIAARVGTKNPEDRSQSTHNSEEVPETGWSEGVQEGG